MKKLFYAFSIAIIFMSCEKESSDDEFMKVENKKWFKEIKTPCDETTICKLRINKGLYNGDTVYYTTFVGALCDMYFSTSLVNINGDTLRSYSGPYELTNFNNEVQLIEIIYRCEDN